MTKVQPFSRITSGNREINTLPDASLPPRMQHMLRPRRARPTERQAARKALAVGEARRNDTVDFIRELTSPARKRGGARFGPAPEEPPHPGMQAPKPMTDEKRRAVYSRFGRRGLTKRQLRQFVDRVELHGGAVGRAGRKGIPTPKRGAR